MYTYYINKQSLCNKINALSVPITQAAKRNLVYPNFAWIIYAWYPEGWWTEGVANETLDGCTDEMLEDFLAKSRALLLHILPEPDNSSIATTAGIV